MDMETSDDEDEDGQVTKLEEEEDRLNRIYGSKESPAAEEPMSLDDLQKVRLTRDMLAKNCLAPWFEDYVKGAWVRYLIGSDEQQNPIYRVCEVVSAYYFRFPSVSYVSTMLIYSLYVRSWSEFSKTVQNQRTLH